MSFLVKIWDFLIYTNILSANKDNLTSTFDIFEPFFFNCIFSPNRTLIVILNMYGKSRQPCFVSDFNEIAMCFSPFDFLLTVGLVKIAFIEYSYVLCIPDLSKTFIVQEYSILLTTF